MKYIVPAIPPSNNQFIGRSNRWEYQKSKKQWALYIMRFCKPKPSSPIKRAVVTIYYFFPDKRRRDPDNYSGKMILDGLVNAGILEDDSFSCIRLYLGAYYDKQNPRTEIEIQRESKETGEVKE